MHPVIHREKLSRVKAWQQIALRDLETYLKQFRESAAPVINFDAEIAEARNAVMRDPTPAGWRRLSELQAQVATVGQVANFAQSLITMKQEEFLKKHLGSLKDAIVEVTRALERRRDTIVSEDARRAEEFGVTSASSDVLNAIDQMLKTAERAGGLANSLEMHDAINQARAELGSACGEPC